MPLIPQVEGLLGAGRVSTCGARIRWRIGPRTLFRLPVFIAALLTLAVTVASRLAWSAWPFELVSNFPVQLAILGVVIAILAVLLAAKVTMVIAITGVLINAVVASSTFTTEPRPERAGSVQITLGHLNAQTRPIDVPALGEYVMKTHPDVFVVLDPTQSDVPRLTHAAPGYRVWRTGGDASTSPDYVRTVVFSRVPVDRVRYPVDRDFGTSAVELIIRADVAPIAMIVFGTESPTTPARAQRRDRALTAAAKWSRAHHGRRVVMGDFNATPWSPSFQNLIRDGDLVDSLDGFGLQVSWPEWNPLLRIPIDHALLGPRLAATDRGTGPAFGSQHRSLHVTVASAR